MTDEAAPAPTPEPVTDEARAAAAAAAGAPEGLRIVPPERQFFRPAGLGVERTANGEFWMNFMVSPFKTVTIILESDGDRDEVIRQLTGGIQIARTVPA